MRIGKYICDCLQDWAEWFTKLKWSFISFRFLSFFGFCGLLIAFWKGLEVAFMQSVNVATELHVRGYIDKEHVKDIITQAQNVLYNEAVGHVSILAAGVLIAIVGLKMVSDHIEGKLAEQGKDLRKYVKKND